MFKMLMYDDDPMMRMHACAPRAPQAYRAGAGCDSYTRSTSIEVFQVYLNDARAGGADGQLLD
eukprot:SAG31_NODE_6478_length_2002_cov_2.388862_3_plen_63_part_00